MITIADLKTSLLDLLHEIDGSGIRLIIGGGFGIYLKLEHVRRNSARTMLERWPEPRSTNDMDLFLRAELLIDSSRLSPLREALDKLGYHVVPGAEHYQFIKTAPGAEDAGAVKVDILTGPQSFFQSAGLKTDSRRVRPKPSVGLHAHPVDEVPTLEENLLTLPITGKLSSGVSWQAEVLIPHPYSFLLMKLFAFRDLMNNENKEFGRYHALDLYSIVATILEREWRQAQEMRDRHGIQPPVVEAGDLVAMHFSRLDRPGMIRLRESAYYRPEFQLPEFMSILQELFPVRHSQ